MTAKHFVTLALSLIFIMLTIPAFGGTPDEARQSLANELGETGIENNVDAFFSFVSSGGTHYVELFLDAGIDPNIKNSKGATALMIAVAKKSEDQLGNDNNTVAQYVSRVTALTKAGYSQSDAMLKVYCPELVELLLSKGADINAVDNNGNTALAHATALGNIEAVKTLISKGAQINSKNSFGTTPLYAAILTNHTEIAKFLTDKGADLNIQTSDGMTALMAAIAEGHFDIAKLLIDKGTNINLKNNLGATALLEAIDKGSVEIVKTLLEKDADVNAKNVRGTTALMLAANNNNPEIVRLLLDHNADFNAKNDEGGTALAIAEKNGYTEVTKLLKDRENKFTPKVIFALIMWLTVISTSIWVYFDAKRYSSKYSPGTWVFFCVLLWIVAFPMYLFKRNKAAENVGGVYSDIEKNIANSVSNFNDCPNCGLKNLDREECPNCGTAMPASEYIAEQERKAEEEGANSEVNSSGASELAMKKCAYCYSEIDSRATYCPHCQKYIGNASQQPVDENFGNSDIRLILGLIGSISLFIGVFTPAIGLPLTSVTFFQYGNGDQYILLGAAFFSILFSIKKEFVGLWITGFISAAVIIFDLVSFYTKVNDAKMRVASGTMKDLSDIALQVAQLQWGWGLLFLGVVLM